jgi:Flp pilus assembly protein TadG
MSKQFKFREKGQELVEFAIILALLMVVLLVIFDLGRVTFFYSVVHNAAREGARYGITDQNASQIQQVAIQKASGLEIDPAVSFTTDTVTVTIDYDFVPVTPILNLLIDQDSITLHARATMAIEK